MRDLNEHYAYDKTHNQQVIFTWVMKHPFIPERVPVTVWVDYDVNGNPRPWAFRDEEGNIVKLLNHEMDVRPTQSRREGDAGKYFTTNMEGKRLELYLTSHYGIDWEDHYSEHEARLPVRVFFENSPEGYRWPWKIAHTKSLEIDELLDVRQASNIEAGIQGMRYLCRIGNRFLQLFLDGSYWVVPQADLDFVMGHASI